MRSVSFSPLLDFSTQQFILRQIKWWRSDSECGKMYNRGEVENSCRDLGVNLGESKPGLLLGLKIRLHIEGII